MSSTGYDKLARGIMEEASSSTFSRAVVADPNASTGKAEAEAEAKTMEEDMLTSWRGDKTGCPTMTQLCTAPTMKIEDTEAGEEVMVEDIKVS
jgi:hypothetical protein